MQLKCNKRKRNSEELNSFAFAPNRPPSQQPHFQKCTRARLYNLRPLSSKGTSTTDSTRRPLIPLPTATTSPSSSFLPSLSKAILLSCQAMALRVLHFQTKPFHLASSWIQPIGALGAGGEKGSAVSELKLNPDFLPSLRLSSPPPHHSSISVSADLE